MGRFIDITGEKYGKLTVIGRDGHSKAGHICWKCKCECGNEISLTSQYLRTGSKQSCGCDCEHAKKYYAQTKTNDNTVSTYVVWKHMIDRCYNHNNIRYSRYGGRNITVCERWKNSLIILCKI